MNDFKGYTFARIRSTGKAVMIDKIAGNWCLVTFVYGKKQICIHQNNLKKF